MDFREKLKSLVKKKLTKDLSHAEIILDDDGSIWFIDRNEKYWFLEFKKSGKLWWRYQFFSDFFKIFSLEQSEYEPLMVEWVEEVLKRKVVSPLPELLEVGLTVEEVLKRKVVSPHYRLWCAHTQVEEVLKRKVVSPKGINYHDRRMVEEVLKRKVVSPVLCLRSGEFRVEEVLKQKVISSWGY